MSGRQQRVMVQPINVIFKNLQQRTKVVIWLYDNIDMRIEGQIIGFDEFMNLVIDDAAEIFVKDAQPRKELGRILLKGDNITLIQQVV
ncbi:Sm-like ribonucleoprotein [Guyanagaster necrorhizus]|uniref:Small nuclear ribonucleoprotein E n=1 Tax=Guyanagaster necrorhizus TaxID=856835 RepID=A0A9P8AW00_9AGAR|nr:Sm-like ribonucleoprotein [Guyanagaster necrorhizus MCA 3950]KAG7450109.1 Sm-like ribonucleoprotein [Guyanagaster necrorhizus MCA 3950]